MHTPLHLIEQRTSVITAGRIQRDDAGIWLANAHTRLRIHGTWDLEDGDLVRVSGTFGADGLEPSQVEVIAHGERGNAIPTNAPIERDALLVYLREFFGARAFLEVETPNLVTEPGTDRYLEPLEAGERYLHTSPEFAMKRLLVDGFERIFQIAKVYRDGEVGALHNPEFTILEWYRAWEHVEAIIADVEALVSGYLDIEPGFEKITMQDLFLEVLDIDILALDTSETLRKRVIEVGALQPPENRRWDEIFFELMVTHIDEALRARGPVFVTHWPVSQAVLACKDPDDPRVALRFELYVDGLEIANGFEELVDPVEQRARFEDDLRQRRQQGLDALPMPTDFLNALERGMPPSAGVALGLDRLLMLRMGASRIDEVAPFAWYDG